jgi:hypothetical protein
MKYLSYTRDGIWKDWEFPFSIITQVQKSIKSSHQIHIVIDSRNLLIKIKQSTYLEKNNLKFSVA